jgi:putative transposase
LPKYLRKTKSIEELVPWLYLKVISTNDFPEALQALLGLDAKRFSPTTITRLKSVREEEYDEWSKRLTYSSTRSKPSTQPPWSVFGKIVTCC